MEKIEALAKYLECEEGELTPSHGNAFAYGQDDYLVLTDSEADEYAKAYIKDSVWAFNASFLEAHIPCDLSDRAIKSLQKMQEELCGDANDLLLAMIGDFDHFVQDAIGCDGRGYFLSSYDGEETECEGYYIYRV